MLYLLVVTYSTVFLTELLGDKTIYTVGSLVIRFHPSSVFYGITAAFMGKMLAAVLIGQALAELPATVVGITSAVTFFTMALVIWFKKTEEATTAEKQHRYSSRAALISFAAIFFSEWGDAGQLTAAVLVARYPAPLIVWTGATLALITKGVLSM